MMNSIISMPPRIPRELNQGGTSTSEATFSSDGTLPVILPIPSGILDGTTAGTWAATGAGPARASSRFRAIAHGRCTSVSAGNVTVKMYYGTSLTPGSNTALASTGAVSVTGSQNWMLEVLMIHDATSGILNGQYIGQLGATRVGPTTITAVPTSVNFNNNSTLGLTVTGTFGTGVATNALYLDWFVLVLG